MKTLKISFLALASFLVVACNQNNSGDNNNADSTDIGPSMNDSIANTDNPPASRDLASQPEVDLSQSALTYTETNSQMKLVLPNADVFEEGSATFKSGYEATLQEAFNVINERGFGKVLVSGNTGREGDAAANKTLSSERAIAITKWLKDKEPKKEISVTSQGVGSQYPMIAYELKDGSPNTQANELNNRTEITFRKSQLPSQ